MLSMGQGQDQVTVRPQNVTIGKTHIRGVPHVLKETVHLQHGVLN